MEESFKCLRGIEFIEGKVYKVVDGKIKSETGKEVKADSLSSLNSEGYSKFEVAECNILTLERLKKENPELEVKFMIHGDTREDDQQWFVGEIRGVSLSDYIEYEDRVYDDLDDLEDYINGRIDSEEEAAEEIGKLQVKKVIWVTVGV